MNQHVEQPVLTALITTDRVQISASGLMSAKNAAIYLGRSEGALANMRCRGEGPRYIKRGRVYYRKADLDSWLDEAQVMSTGQARVLFLRGGAAKNPN
jgi:hypothetical protein